MRTSKKRADYEQLRKKLEAILEKYCGDDVVKILRSDPWFENVNRTTIYRWRKCITGRTYGKVAHAIALLEAEEQAPVPSFVLRHLEKLNEINAQLQALRHSVQFLIRNLTRSQNSWRK